jgi:hypothetical protein
MRQYPQGTSKKPQLMTKGAVLMSSNEHTECWLLDKGKNGERIKVELRRRNSGGFTRRSRNTISILKGIQTMSELFRSPCETYKQ